MRALTIDAAGRISIDDVRIPARADECLIRVRMTGICGTDLEVLPAP